MRIPKRIALPDQVLRLDNGWPHWYAVGRGSIRWAFCIGVGLGLIPWATRVAESQQGWWLLLGSLLMAAASAPEPQPRLGGLSPSDLYQRIVETEPECVKLLGPDGRFLDINPAGLAMLEAESRGQILGRVVWDLVVPEHRNRLQEHLSRVFQGESGEVEFEIVGLRGTRRVVQSRSAPLRDASGRVAALLGITRDVTEIKRAQQTLRESEERFRSLLESTSDWVWEVNERWEFTYTSPRVENLLGFAPAEIVGRTLWDLSPAVEKEAVQQRLSREAVRQRAAQCFEHRLRHTDGRLVCLETTGVAHFDPAGRFSGYRFISRDVTERNRVQELLRRTEEQQRQRRRELEHLARLSAMGALLAGIAHEVNQPLHAIKNYAEAMLASMDPARPPQLDKWADWAAHIAAQVERAGEILKRLQAFSRNRELQSVKMEFPTLLHEVLSLLEGEALRLGVRVQTSVVDPLPPIQGDRLQLQQLLLNLLRNACEAAAESPDGGRVELTAAMEGETLVVRVSDNGPGLPPIDPQQLFEPFFTTKRDGLGMGLAISRAIVEAHGGSLRAQTRPEGGTLFECRLPIANEDTIA